MPAGVWKAGRACPLKPNCSPNMPSRRIVRDVHEAARDVARALAKTKTYELSRHLRKTGAYVRVRFVSIALWHSS
jgi:hypothetical protein